jgi:hypothetical protein
VLEEVARIVRRLPHVRLPGVRPELDARQQHGQAAAVGAEAQFRKEYLIDFLKSVFHNVVVHPILPFLPRTLARAIHAKNAEWAYGKEGPFKGLD